MLRGVFRDGFPSVEITIEGASDRTIDAVIDTGHNGYLSLPYDVAFGIGLTLVMVGSGKLANGSPAPELVCAGKVRIAGQAIDADISVLPEGRTLIGTKLLHDAGLKVLVDVRGEVVQIYKRNEEVA